MPLWFIGQKIAPKLDKKFDKAWIYETTGYFVVAQKISHVKCAENV